MRIKTKNPAIKVNPQKWLELYGDTLYQYALPRVNDNMIAEDLIQETFFSALKGLDGYKGKSSEKNWLFAILKNKIIDFYRKKSNERSVFTKLEYKSESDNWFNNEGRWAENRKPKNWNAADNPVEKKEFQKVINWCKDHLKELEKHVFTLKYLEYLDSAEICKVLNISSSNYWVLIHRARLKVRDCVEKHWLKS